MLAAACSCPCVEYLPHQAWWPFSSSCNCKTRQASAQQVLRKCSASAQQVQEWREFSIKVAKGEIQTAAPSALGFRREWTRQSNCQVASVCLVMRMTGCRDLSEESNGQIVYEAIWLLAKGIHHRYVHIVFLEAIARGYFLINGRGNVFNGGGTTNTSATCQQGTELGNPTYDKRVHGCSSNLQVGGSTPAPTFWDKWCS